MKQRRDLGLWQACQRAERTLCLCGERSARAACTAQATPPLRKPTSAGNRPCFSSCALHPARVPLFSVANCWTALSLVSLYHPSKRTMGDNYPKSSDKSGTVPGGGTV